jgi:putative DNA methylase
MHGSDLNAEMKKKLIEVALPLEAINKEAAREKSIRHGHPSTLHLWWARRPLAACRAVLFASLVDDPSSRPEEFPTEADQDRERQRLFRLIEELVKWENSNNKQIFAAAHQEILKSTNSNLPPISDPFCGGGSIPLEAQRLGLKANASDLNPVAVLITKALMEIPPQFAGRPPVHPMPQGRMSGKGMWEGAHGLSADIRYYGQWMRDRASERIAHIYPKVRLTKEHGGGEATVIAWLWARTVQCPNPACGARMPLIRTFALSTKAGKKVRIQPHIDTITKSIRFDVQMGDVSAPDGTVNRRGARCLVCGTAVPFDYIRAEGRSGKMGVQLTAIVAEGQRGRLYLSPDEEHAAVACSVQPTGVPETSLPPKALGFRVQVYGMTRHRDLFTPRQLVLLTTLSQLVLEARQQAIEDGAGTEYANAIATYLALTTSRLANTHCSLALWSPSRDQSKNVFSRQALAMAWDYAEVNPFAGAAGDFAETSASMAESVAMCPATPIGYVNQLDATSTPTVQQPMLHCTDPPYYDNIGYADLSDFFYVWLRSSLSTIYPDLFSTLLVPKAQELVATPYRFEGSREKAQEFFEHGFGKAFDRMRENQSVEYPLTVFYAFKQSESEEGEDDEDTAVASTGWETMLEGLVSSEFQITGTWPMRSERAARTVAAGTNALASSIVLACRPRPESAPITTRKDLISALKNELPHAVRDMQKGNIAPVDLAQAAIGPGMAVFSRYKKVLESDGSPMRVRTALGLINQTLDEVLSEQEGEFDPDTRWALAWFEQHAFDEGLYGEAEVLATAKALSVSALDETKILHSRAGKVRLLRRDELSADWNPATEHRLTVWAVTQHLIRSLDKNGETATASLASMVGGLAESARDLAYRLYILSERKGWAEEAGYYNSLVVSWPAIAPKAFALS